MSQQKKIYALIALVAVAAVVWLLNRNDHQPAFSGVAADESYQPLKVDDPRLRMDLLERIARTEYTGTHRNIFNKEAPPPPAPTLAEKAKEHARNVGPQKPPPPPPPPPIVVPATFFGYSQNPRTGKKQAFFTNNEDVFVVEEGGILLNNYRLLKIGNNSAELEEVSSGRHTTVNLDVTAAPGGNGSNPSPSPNNGGPPNGAG